MRKGSLLGLGFVGLAAGFGALLLTPAARAQGDGAAPAATGAASVAPSATGETPPAPSTEDPNKKKAAATGETAPAPAPAGGGVTVTVGTGGGTTDPSKKDEGAKAAPAKEEAPAAPNPFRGSILILDQSMTAVSFSKGAQLTPQSLYEWWISPRVNYNFESVKGLRVTLRQDVFKEWTNTQDDFQYKNEWRYTDTWMSAGYGMPLKMISDRTRLGLGVTFRPGISKSSRVAGQYFTLGPSANISHSFELAGEKARFFKSLNVSASGLYQHAFTKCNTACNLGDDNLQGRMNANGQVVQDSQVRFGTLTGNTLLSALNFGVEIMDHLEFDFSAIYISSFSYAPSQATLADGTVVPRSEADTRLRQSSWYLLMLNYGVTKELDLTLGYYNFSNVLQPNGNYRNPFYSPDGARFFFDVIIHLDAVWDDITGADKKKGGKGTGSGRVF
ncbi:MAG: hypothetical protein JNL79_19450 [Myxococcales bacterium]|nr:hypothetical protein [Myxococcales bacterium]